MRLLVDANDSVHIGYEPKTQHGLAGPVCRFLIKPHVFFDRPASQDWPTCLWCLWIHPYSNVSYP